MTTPKPEATHLRDARLHKALEHAPDAHAAAPAAIREAILRQARHVAAPTPASATAASPLHWWRRLLGSPPRARRPWNTAFASVLLAGVVVGLWWDREVPGPQPDTGMRDLPAATAPPVTDTPTPSAPPAQTPAPAPPPQAAGTDARDASQPRPPAPATAPERRETSKATAPDAMPPPAAVPAPVRREESNATAPHAMPPAPAAAPAPERREASKAAPPADMQTQTQTQTPPAATQESSRTEPFAAGASGATATDATSPPPETSSLRRSTMPRQEGDVQSSRIAQAQTAPAAPPAAAPRAQLGDNALASSRSAAPAAAQEPAAALDAAGWAALRLLSGAGQPRSRSSVPADVAQTIDLMLDTGPTAVPADDPVLLQIVLLHHSGRPLGRLDLGSHSLRWTPAGAGTPRAFAARVEPALSLRVREMLAPR